MAPQHWIVSGRKNCRIVSIKNTNEAFRFVVELGLAGYETVSNIYNNTLDAVLEGHTYPSPLAQLPKRQQSYAENNQRQSSSRHRDAAFFDPMSIFRQFSPWTRRLVG
jgi:hypothetical protein